MALFKKWLCWKEPWSFSKRRPFLKGVWTKWVDSLNWQASFPKNNRFLWGSFKKETWQVKELPSPCKTTFGYYLYMNACLFVILQVGYTCMYVCTIYIYILNIYTCIYVYLYIYTHTHIHIVVCTCMYVCNIQIYVLNIYTPIICVYILKKSCVFVGLFCRKARLS